MSRFSATPTGRLVLPVGALLTSVFVSRALAQDNAETPAPAQEKTGALAPAPSKADEAPPREPSPEYRFDFGLVAGYHFFYDQHVLGDDDPNVSPRSWGLFGGVLGLHFNRWIGVEGEAMLIPTSTRSARISELVIAYRGSFVLNLSDNYMFQPFLLAGGGGLTSLASAAPDGTPEEEIPGSVRNWGFFHAGVGFKVGFTPRVGLRFDGRILGPWTAIFPVSGFAAAKGPDFEAFGGVYINFSEIEKVRYFSKVVVDNRGDKDGDGIPDDVDKCPTEPEDKDGFEDNDGCPDPDNDNDGIPDKLDKCPNDPEDKDGFEDTDGCPDLDNDNDGVPDALDKCPNEPEDKDGFEDNDGCPDPDNDKDGIPDAIDKCPNEPETINKYKDQDGCPDEVPPEVKKFTGVIEGINFKTASAQILPGSYAILDRAVKVLQDYPDVHLEISGHTDSKGRASYNLSLSQHRADAVKMYFVSRGISASRLTSIGYGEDRPIGDNSTASGRASNRRTEFRLINPGEH
jgi:outer membrane protein OmpA-like peptidoglycan-associated protein